MTKTLFDKPLYDVVIEMLETNKYNRDDDYLLYQNLLYRKGISTREITVREFFKKLEVKELPDFQSVTRLRRLAQMKHSHLRGASWYKRRKAGEQLQEEFQQQRATGI